MALFNFCCRFYVLHVDLVVLRSIYLLAVGRQNITCGFIVSDYQENGATSGSCTLQFDCLFICFGHQAQLASSHIQA